MVRLVRSGSRLPGARPRGASMRPAGPWLSKRFFQAYRVCLEMPTSAAKSPAGRPLRRQVSSNSRRCSGVRGEEGSILTRRRPRRPLPTRDGEWVNKTSSGSSAASGGGSSVNESAGGGGLTGGRFAFAAAMGGQAPLRSGSLRDPALRCACPPMAAAGISAPSLDAWIDSSDMQTSFLRLRRK
jgi:hypothetical protein